MEERSITVKSILSQCQYPKHGEAAAFQENLQDVKVTFGLQSRIKEQKDPDGNTVTPAGAWTEVPGESCYWTVSMRSMSPEAEAEPCRNMIFTEMSWSTALWSGEITRMESDGRSNIRKSSENGTFTLTQNGRQVAYESICETASASDAENRTVIVNRIKDTVDYDVVKNWEEIHPRAQP